jgi:predicted nucleic acid-binding protein
MNAASTFFDTNVLLYMLSSDSGKAGVAEATVAVGGVISVQVLNEFVSVARRKFKLSWHEIADALAPIHAICRVVPLTRTIFSAAPGK